MRLTTDAGDKTTLAELISGFRGDLQNRIELAEQRGDGAASRRLQVQLSKLDAQAEAVGVVADPRISPQLRELRQAIAKHKLSKGGAK